MRYRALVALIIAAVAIAACAAGASPTPSPTAVPTETPTVAPTAVPTATPTKAADLTGKKVAFVLWGYDGYQQGQGAHFTKAAEAAGVSVTLIDGKNDPLVQAKAIDDLVAGKIDGIAWQPVDPGAAVEPAKTVQTAGIPLVFVGAAPDKSTGVVAPFLPFNDYEITKKAGTHAGTWLKENKPGEKPKVVLFDLLQLPLCHDWRMTGFMDGIKSVIPDVEVVFWDSVPTSKDGTMAKMEDQLQANPDFNIFTGCGGDLILGGIAGLQAAGRAKAVNKVPQTEWILTIDGTPPEIELLLDPSTSIMETITMTPKENGEQTWDLLKQVMMGDVAPTSDKVVPLPGMILPTDCQELAGIYEAQYGITETYQPLDCSKYGG